MADNSKIGLRVAEREASRVLNKFGVKAKGQNRKDGEIPRRKPVAFRREVRALRFMPN